MPSDVTQPPIIPVRPARPITGRFVLVAFIAFFGVIAAVNAVMMTLAIQTMPGLDVANGYVASQAMNQEIKAMQMQAERGWNADVAVRLENRLAPVSMMLTDKTGSPVTGLAVTARLAHPAMTRADHSARLIEQRPGFYSAELPEMSPGAWTVILEASRNGERVFASRNRIVLTETRP